MTINPYLKNLTCLYVEDDDFIRESFVLMIKRYFKEVFVAENGKIGLELYQKHNPDIIISDIRMPVMDGIEMAKKIKEINPNAYVIFVTAFSDSEYLKAAIELGVEGYLNKPIDRNLLIKKLNFLAEYIKNERETKELFSLLQLLFDMQIEASILYEDDEARLCNKKFVNLFKECMGLDALIDKYKIDLSSEHQVIYSNEFTYQVTIQTIDKYKIISFQDITNYEHEIFTDELTKVYSRKYLAKAIEKLKNEKQCILMFDIDHFKNINDTYGHPTGDKVLAHLANILKQHTRKDDVVIRAGGEEFLVLLDGVQECETAKEIAEKIRKAVEESEVEGIKLTISGGVCCGKVENEDEFQLLYKKADTALYVAKESGRNQIRECN